MKIRRLLPESMLHGGELIAAFGEAKLVKTLECKYELRGGSRQDRAEAREWISMFFHDNAVSEV